MNKEYLIQLTQNLYHATLLFPKKEPLRYKMRELADEILANFYKKQNPEIFKNFEILDSYFEVARVQNWISLQDVLNLQKEYSKVREILKETPEPPELKPQIAAAGLVSKNFSQRQEIILKFLKENGRAQVWQLKEILPEVSKRTLRRDFESLFSQGVIERIGERNDTFYTLTRQSRAKGEEEDLSSSTQLKQVGQA